MANKGTFKKGEIRPGQGKRGPSKTTLEFRATVQKVLDANADNVAIWLAQVAEGHGETKAAPEKALDLLARLAEFAAPKLARTEVTGANGGPVVIAASQIDERL